MHWREIVNLIEARLRPGRFSEELNTLAKQGYPPEEAVHFLSGLLGHYLVEVAALTAALSSPAEGAVEELRQLALRLGALDFGSGADHLPRYQQSLYYRLVRDLRALLPELGLAMAAVLAVYVSDDYDLESNPNDLLIAANHLAEQELGEAKSLVARAGALGLRGKAFWWGWPREIAAPLRRWTTLVAGFVDNVTQEGKLTFGEVAAERERWAREAEFTDPFLTALAEGYVSLAEVQFGQQPPPSENGIEELVYELFHSQGKLSLELRDAFQAHREQAIPYLIALAQDQRLWGSQSRGGGWAPLHAVRLLGELKAEAAVEPLLQILTLTEPDDYLHDYALTALQAIGQAALPALLDLFAYSRDLPFKLSLAPTLGAIGEGNEAAYEALLALYRETDGQKDAGLAILGLAALQDERAIPLLEASLKNGRLLPIEKAEVREALVALRAKAAGEAVPLR